MKTLKDYLVELKHTQEEFDAMNASEKAGIFNALSELNAKAYKVLVENGEATKEELAKAIEDMNKAQVDSTTSIFKALEAQGLAIGKLLKGDDNAKPLTLKGALSENKDAIKDLVKGVTHNEIMIKADTNIASITTNDGAFVVGGVGQLGNKKLNALNVFPKVMISGDNVRSTIKYYDWDELTTIRAAASLAEGAVFPESTAKFKGYDLPIRKIGDTLPVTDEFFEDESMFAAELEMFLLTNVDIICDDQIINGTGLGTQLTGLVTASPAFVPVASAITDASIYDLIIKVSEDITSGRGSKYSPDIAFLNIVDINKMRLKKDGNNNYILPPFVDRSGNVVGSITIIEDNHVVANTLIMGDRRFGKIYEAAGVTVARGEVDAQFVEDMSTLKVRKRLAFLVREVDKTGFRKVTSISAALVTLAL